MKKIVVFVFCCSLLLQGTFAQEKKYYFNSNKAYTLIPEMFGLKNTGSGEGIGDIRYRISPEKIAKGTTQRVNVTAVKQVRRPTAFSSYWESMDTLRFEVSPVSFKTKEPTEEGVAFVVCTNVLIPQDIEMTAGDFVNACLYKGDTGAGAPGQTRVALTDTGENPKGGTWNVKEKDNAVRTLDDVSYLNPSRFDAEGPKKDYNLVYTYVDKGCTYTEQKKLTVSFSFFGEKDYRIGKYRAGERIESAGSGEALDFKIEPNTDISEVRLNEKAFEDYSWSWDFGDGVRVEDCAFFYQSYVYAKEGVKEVMCELKNKNTGCPHPMATSVTVSADPKDSPEPSLLQKIRAESAAED